MKNYGLTNVQMNSIRKTNVHFIINFHVSATAADQQNKIVMFFYTKLECYRLFMIFVSSDMD